MTEQLRALADKYFEEMRSLRRELHRRPELSLQEFETTKLIRKTLEKHGVPLENIPSRTGVSAFIPGKDPSVTIMLREDIDALPILERTGLPFASENTGVMHACGHDLHTATLLLAGAMLQDLRESLPCNVRLLFQYGEEVFAAGKMISESVEGLRPAADLIVGLHCDPRCRVGQCIISRGPAKASADVIRMKIRGKGGHGAYPHKVVDPVVAAAYLIAQLQTLVSRERTPFEPVVLSFGSIHGGTAPNVIPDCVEIAGTLRTFSSEVRSRMWESVRRVGEHGGEALRCQVETEIVEGVPVLYNDEKIVDVLTGTMGKIIGADQIVPHEPSPGSDDFSCFLSSMPGAQFYLGTANEDPRSSLGLHNAEVVFDEEAIRIGALLLTRFVFDYMEDKAARDTAGS